MVLLPDATFIQKNRMNKIKKVHHVLSIKKHDTLKEGTTSMFFHLRNMGKVI